MQLVEHLRKLFTRQIQRESERSLCILFFFWREEAALNVRENLHSEVPSGFVAQGPMHQQLKASYNSRLRSHASEAEEAALTVYEALMMHAALTYCCMRPS